MQRLEEGEESGGVRCFKIVLDLISFSQISSILLLRHVYCPAAHEDEATEEAAAQPAAHVACCCLADQASPTGRPHVGLVDASMCATVQI